MGIGTFWQGPGNVHRSGEAKIGKAVDVRHTVLQQRLGRLEVAVSMEDVRMGRYGKENGNYYVVIGYMLVLVGNVGMQQGLTALHRALPSAPLPFPSLHAPRHPEQDCSQITRSLQMPLPLPFHVGVLKR